jgi:hypothetical protein
MSASQAPISARLQVLGFAVEFHCGTGAQSGPGICSHTGGYAVSWAAAADAISSKPIHAKRAKKGAKRQTSRRERLKP